MMLVIAIALRKVRDHLPLQQGLRLKSLISYKNSQNQYETIFHYNKD